MRVAIDISSVIYETGVSWYTRNLVKSLLKIDETDQFLLFGGSLRRERELRQFVDSVAQKNVESKIVPFPPILASFLWNNLHRFPIENFIGKVDVFHSSDWTQPPSKAFKVTTIHDLVPLRFPEISHPQIVKAHKQRLKWVKKEVDKVITVSQATKKEIIELLDISPERINVIPEAPDLSFKKHPKEDVSNVLKKYRINRDYLLVVGADPRKNISAAIQAFVQVRKRMTGLNLVIVGRPWEDIPNMEGVKVLGHIGREELASLYSGAKTLVYTSLYEGFGLPILEAMQLECPVVTSNISSMPEVAGKAAVLVNPKDPSNIAKGIEKAFKEKEELIKKGKERAREFSWERTAQETLKVYAGSQNFKHK